MVGPLALGFSLFSLIQALETNPEYAPPAAVLCLYHEKSDNKKY
jgi:hypothetical protein